MVSFPSVILIIIDGVTFWFGYLKAGVEWETGRYASPPFIFVFLCVGLFGQLVNRSGFRLTTFCSINITSRRNIRSFTIRFGLFSMFINYAIIFCWSLRGATFCVGGHFISRQATRYVSQGSQDSLVRTWHARCVPNKRLSTILVSSSAIQHIYMRVLRSLVRTLLPFPEEVHPIVWVDRIVTQLITIHVLTGRSNSVSKNFFAVGLKENNRWYIRTYLRLFFAASHKSGIIRVVEYGRAPLGNVPFNVVTLRVKEVAKVRQYAREAVPRRPTRRLNLQIWMTFMMFYLYHVLFYRFHVSYFDNSLKGAPIVMNRLWSPKGEFKGQINQSGTMFLLVVKITNGRVRLAYSFRLLYRVISMSE